MWTGAFFYNTFFVKKIYIYKIPFFTNFVLHLKEFFITFFYIKIEEHIKKVKLDLGYILETYYAILDFFLDLKAIKTKSFEKYRVEKLKNCEVV